ncbi:replication initiation protein RepC [Roseibium aggregatum]|uniref:Replication initiation protein RepC n=2 Tax=Roseibium aggregatum TaxID=187304 RepID=A0A0M6YEP7_9HYPH|nr:replication initiation protein RepC [Roseibium aggregatum]
METAEFIQEPARMASRKRASGRDCFRSGPLKARSGLPAGKSKTDIFKVLKGARKSLGLGIPTLTYLEHLIGYTNKDDWREGGVPIVYVSVERLALELNVSVRTINTYERQLASRGLTLWSDSGNRKRYARRAKDGTLTEVYGVVLTPIAERFGELEGYAEGERIAAEGRLTQIGFIRSCRREINEALLRAQVIGLEGPIVEQAEAAVNKVPRTFSSRWTFIELCSLGLELEDIDTRLNEAIEPYFADKTSDQPEENVRHHNTTHTSLNLVNICNRAAPKRTSPAGDEIILQTEPANAGGMEEVSGRRTSDHESPPGAEDRPDTGTGGTGIEHIRFDQVTDVASELMRELIAEEAGQGRENWSALDRAAATAAAWIGVSPSLWASMRAQIGPAAAAVSVVLVERRMTDPDNPVSKPGGYLRGMLAKAGRGQLHLHKSIFGLSKSATARREPAPRRCEADWLPARQIHQVGASPRNPSRLP